MLFIRKQKQELKPRINILVYSKAILENYLGAIQLHVYDAPKEEGYSQTVRLASYGGIMLSSYDAPNEGGVYSTVR